MHQKNYVLCVLEIRRVRPNEALKNKDSWQKVKMPIGKEPLWEIGGGSLGISYTTVFLRLEHNEDLGCGGVETIQESKGQIELTHPMKDVGL